MKKIRAFRCSSALILCLLASACATVSPQQRSKYDVARETLAREHQSILVSGCVVRDEVGSDVVLRTASQKAGETLGRSARTFLAASGMKVTVARFPLLCNGLKAPAGDLNLIADTVDSPRKRISTPIPQAANVSDEAPIVLAYEDLYREVGYALRERAVKKGGYVSLDNSEALRIDDEPLKLLKSDLGNSVWILSRTATEVSTGKAIGVAVLTSLVGVAATGGSGAYTYFVPGSSMGTIVALVSLDQKKLVWANLGALNGTSAALPAAGDNIAIMDWGRALFAPLFDPTRKQVAQVVADLDAPIPANALTRAPPRPRPKPKPVVAYPPAVLPIFKAGTMLTATSGLSLFSQADPTLTANTTVIAGSSLRVSQGVKAPDGNWYYVSATEGSGWASEIALKQATK